MGYDFKEYTKLRDIVRKRNIRASEQGLTERVHFPTVKEIKSGMVDYRTAMKAVKDFYSGGSTVKAIKQTGMAPEVVNFPRMEKRQQMTVEERKERKREQDRAYRQRRQLRDRAVSPEMAKKHISYLKALDTVSKSWAAAGFDLGLDLSQLTPSQAQSFVEYMDFRFAQGDFTQMYVIDEFIQDFSRLKKTGYKMNDILNDYNRFLADRNKLYDNSANMTGVSAGTVMESWGSYLDYLGV